MQESEYCQFVQDHLDDLATGQLEGLERHRAEDHLLDCLACLQSWSEHVNIDSIESLPPIHVAERKVCDQAEQRLSSWLDRELDWVDDELIHQHLEHCEHCAPLAEALVQLLADLPVLATLEPGEDFVADVLAMTSDADLHRESFWRWTYWFSMLVRRPRFAMEAAYLLSIVIFLGLKLGSGLEIDRQKLNAGPRKIQTELVEIRDQADRQYQSAQGGVTQGWYQIMSHANTGLSFVSEKIEDVNGVYRTLVKSKPQITEEKNSRTGWRRWLNWFQLSREPTVSPGEGV